MKNPLQALLDLPPGSLARRVGFAALVGLGTAMTAFGSMFVQMMGPVPFKVLPDARPLVFFLGGFLPGLFASGGGPHRRTLALWSVVAFVVGFHLEEATVHWIGPYPGSITGTRVGLLGTAGSILAVVGLLLIHLEVESVKLRRDLEARGARPETSERTTSALVRAGTRRILAIATGVAGMGLLIRGGELVMGDSGAGGTYVLFVGGALLLVLALVLLRLAPPKPQDA